MLPSTWSPMRCAHQRGIVAEAMSPSRRTPPTTAAVTTSLRFQSLSRGDAVVREPRRMQAAGELAQVADRFLELLPRGGHDRRELRVFVDALLEPPEGEQDDRETLLRAVVEVSLEASSLLVGDLDETSTRCLQLVDLPSEVPVEPVALHGDAHGRNERLEEFRPLEEPRVVNDRADLARVVVDERHDTAGDLLKGFLAVDVHVPLALPVPPEDLERRILQDLAQRALDLLRLCEVRDAVEDLTDRVDPGGGGRHTKGL